MKPRLKVLLLAMPDVAFGLPSIEAAPNLGILSIASNLDPAVCEAKVADLVLHRHSYLRYVRKTLREFQPDIVGLSAMTFQYATAVKIATLIRQLLPEAKTVIGGYHASLAYEEIGQRNEAHIFDFIVRGEGEKTTQELIGVLAEKKNDLSAITGLSYLEDGIFHHNPPRELADLATIKPPNADYRMLKSFRFFGRFAGEMVETSRGCTNRCKFCSISRLYGQRYREYSLERVLETIRSAKERGAKGIYFIDDNLTLNGPRFERLCDRLINEGLNDISYWVQVSCRGIASNEALVRKMKEAGFTSVFLGVESISDRNLKFLDKCSTKDEALQAIALLKKYDMGVMLAFIIGNPDDTADDVRAPFRFAKANKMSLLYLQCLTPYPGTRLREELLQAGLVTNEDDYSTYDGWHCNVKTKHLSNHRLTLIYYWQYIRFYLRPFPVIDNLRRWQAPRLVYNMVPVLFLYFFVVFKESAYLFWQRVAALFRK